MFDDVRQALLPGWLFRYRAPQGPGPHPTLLMLHGWKGDERSMWLFASRVPRRFLIVAPRGPYPAPGGGYSWVNRAPENGYPALEQFRPGVNKLIDFLAQKPGAPTGDFSQVHLMGFSQGAACAYAFAALHPVRVRSLAGLAGFVPKGVSEQTAHQPLLDKPMFVAHGSKDELIPLPLAQEGVRTLENAGGSVVYCEDEVGHKLSAGCSQALGRFYAGLEG